MNLTCFGKTYTIHSKYNVINKLFQEELSTIKNLKYVVVQRSINGQHRTGITKVVAETKLLLLTVHHSVVETKICLNQKVMVKDVADHQG